ncbi:EfeM/EfeO family lipoprotein [Streptomyces sp. I05A-00742]|uniref:EfeM/EfeO family lipoprotein n=1 Tax=Streptomyces sp. I05A-00742 TaxID=2732853 RepID=UPI001488BC35|nr:EfeM/EfeO family lipoprotein [Streptomyces sp. I05A-00742]
MTSRRAVLGAGALSLVLCACGAASRQPVAGPDAAGEPAAVTVDVSPGGCGRGWASGRAGVRTFAVRNTAAGPVEARLQEARTGAVLGEVEGVAPGTARQLTARIGAGTYTFVCLPDDGDPGTGPVVRVTGRGVSGPAVVPVTRGELIPAALAYQRWAGRELRGVDGAVRRLRDEVDAGRWERARAAWLVAHLRYLRLGAAYGAFGDLGEAVDRTAAGLPAGLRDPRFTGFHRVEHGLWHGERGPALRAAAHRLAADVRALRDDWGVRGARMDPAELGRRAHEVVEDALLRDLTDRTDHGSGTSLAAARARLDGARRALAPLRPLLRARHIDTTALDRRLDRARHTLDRHHRGAGWTPLARLGRADREAVDARFGDLAERLASVAAVCDVRRVP